MQSHIPWPDASVPGCHGAEGRWGFINNTIYSFCLAPNTCSS